MARSPNRRPFPASTPCVSSHTQPGLWWLLNALGGTPACSVDRLTGLLLGIPIASVEESLLGTRPCAKSCMHSVQGSAAAWEGVDGCTHFTDGELKPEKYASPPGLPGLMQIAGSQVTSDSHWAPWGTQPHMQRLLPTFLPRWTPPCPHPNPPGREDVLLSTCSGLLWAPPWGPPGSREEKQSSKRDGGEAFGGTWWHSRGSAICATDVAHFSPPVDTFHTLRSGAKPRAGKQ